MNISDFSTDNLYIDVNNQPALITAVSSTVVIQNVHFVKSVVWGGFIEIKNSSNLFLEGGTFTGNRISLNNRIEAHIITLMVNSTAMIKRSMFEENNIGCIYSYNNASVTLENSIFINSRVTIISNSKYVTFISRNNTFQHTRDHINVGTDIYCYGNVILEIDSCQFFAVKNGNVASIYLWQNISATIVSSDFHYATGTVLSLGDNVTLSVKDSSFIKPSAEGNTTALKADYHARVLFTGCIFQFYLQIIHASRSSFASLENSSVTSTIALNNTNRMFYMERKSFLYISNVTVIDVLIPHGVFLYATSKSNVSITNFMYTRNHFVMHYRITSKSVMSITHSHFSNNNQSSFAKLPVFIQSNSSNIYIYASTFAQNWGFIASLQSTIVLEKCNVIDTSGGIVMHIDISNLTMHTADSDFARD